MPKANAIPTFHTANAAVAIVTNRSALSLLMWHEPRANWAPVKNKITPQDAGWKEPQKRGDGAAEERRNQQQNCPKDHNGATRSRAELDVTGHLSGPRHR
jgi:hypothetical protein